MFKNSIVESSKIIKFIAIIAVRWVAYLILLRILFFNPDSEQNSLLMAIAAAGAVYNLAVSIPSHPLGARQFKPAIAFLDCLVIGAFIVYSPVGIHPHYFLFFFLGPIYYLSQSTGTDGGLGAGLMAGSSHAMAGLLHYYINHIDITDKWQSMIGLFFLYIAVGFIVGYSTERAIREVTAREKVESITSQLSATVRFLGVAAERSRQISEQLTAAMSLMGGATHQGPGKTTSMEDILDQILKGTSEVIKAESGYLMLVEKGTKELHLKASFGTQYIRQPNYPPAKLKFGEDLAGWVAENDQPLLLPKNKPLTKVKGLKENVSFFDALGVPIKVKDAVYGVIIVNNKKGGETFTQDDLKLLGTIAGETAMVLTNASLYEETLEKQVALDRLIKRVRNAQEDERARIARDLHDGIAQNLAGLILEFDFLKKLIAKDAKKAAGETERMESIVKDTVVELRKLIYDLRPTTLDTVGLIPTLESYIEQFSLENKIKSEKDIHIESKMDEVAETNIFRFVQEALNNIRKHAGAKSLRVVISEAKGELEILISDDGEGFNVEKLMPSDSKGGGFGLFGMKERIEFLKGEFRIESTPENGTKVIAKVPIAKT